MKALTDVLVFTFIIRKLVHDHHNEKNVKTCACICIRTSFLIKICNDDKPRQPLFSKLLKETKHLMDQTSNFEDIQ